MRHYIDSNQNYYEGDKRNLNDIETQQRPSDMYKYDKGNWIFDDDKNVIKINDEVKKNLEIIDSKSIRNIREFLIQIHNNITELDKATTIKDIVKALKKILLIDSYIKNYEIEANIERSKIKNKMNIVS